MESLKSGGEHKPAIYKQETVKVEALTSTYLHDLSQQLFVICQHQCFTQQPVFQHAQKHTFRTEVKMLLE